MLLFLKPAQDGAQQKAVHYRRGGVCAAQNMLGQSTSLGCVPAGECQCCKQHQARDMVWLLVADIAYRLRRMLSSSYNINPLRPSLRRHNPPIWDGRACLASASSHQ